MKKSIASKIKKVGIAGISIAMFASMSHAAKLQIADANKVQTAPKFQRNLNIQRANSLGIDPAVTHLQITKSSGGRLTATATVRNIGTHNFVSGANQAALIIQVHDRRVSGPAAYRTIATRGFTHLSTSGSIVATGNYVMDGFVEWSDPTLDPGECNSDREIIAMISYDPDIRMDGNPQNDDARSSNNMKKQVVGYVAECPW